jgi:DNA-binding transcriptional regulator LsrR (DeoR family)
MRPGQFKALASLTSLRDSRTHRGAWLVLVDGATQTEAAQAVGVSQQAISKAVRRLKEVKRLALKVY